MREIANRLESEGLRVWLDESQFNTSNPIIRKIDEGLMRSRKLLLCMSAHAHGSDWVKYEIDWFRARDPLNRAGRFIILRIDDSEIEEALQKYHYIDWQPTNRIHEKLMAALKQPEAQTSQVPNVVDVCNDELCPNNSTVALAEKSPSGGTQVTGNLVNRIGRRIIISIVLMIVVLICLWLNPFSSEIRGKIVHTNTLGMKFVSVPGAKVLFCVHETRKMDYAAYAANVSNLDGLWKVSSYQRILVTPHEDCPVTMVNYSDATNFCQWLTTNELARSKLPPGSRYRLPTDREWSLAVGIGSLEDGDNPKENGKRLESIYPWGSDWPPSNGKGNYADIAAGQTFTNCAIVEGYWDGHPTTSRAMSFPANSLGIFDLGGNVWEWCSDFYESTNGARVLRGASWNFCVAAYLKSSSRLSLDPQHRGIGVGFRVVLEE